MNERRKLINWMAGVTTFIVVLLIVIVLLDREEDGVSLAAASRTVALTLESGNGILENAPETSNFDEDLSDQWYVKYMDYLYGQGYLDRRIGQSGRAERYVRSYIRGSFGLGKKGIGRGKRGNRCAPFLCGFR